MQSIQQNSIYYSSKLLLCFGLYISSRLTKIALCFDTKAFTSDMLKHGVTTSILSERFMIRKKIVDS